MKEKGNYLYCLAELYPHWTVFISGNPALKNALLEDQDISPDLGHSLLLQTEDQNFDENFVQIEPPLGPLEDYMFSLEEGEGISDFFDTCPFDL